ncbi:MAG: adenosylcobinamide-GDP ribazoletransferase [Thermosulfidibacteraceae bacterium]
MDELRFLILSIQFLTTIPIPITIEVDRDEFYKIASYFPVVGFIVGVLTYGFCHILKSVLIFDITATLTILFYLLITGAMHVDGLADTVDGLMSHRKKEEILRIMKDPRLGTFGAITVIFDILLRVMVVKSIQDLRLFVVAPIISRFCGVFAIYISNSVASKGLGSLFIGRVRLRELLIATILSFLLSITSVGLFTFLYLVIITTAIAIVSARYIERRIGGMTGDTIGAIIEISELIVYLYFSLS